MDLRELGRTGLCALGSSSALWLWLTYLALRVVSFSPRRLSWR